MRLLPWAPHIEHPTLHTHTHSLPGHSNSRVQREDRREGWRRRHLLPLALDGAERGVRPRKSQSQSHSWSIAPWHRRHPENRRTGAEVHSPPLGLFRFSNSGSAFGPHQAPDLFLYSVWQMNLVTMKGPDTKYHRLPDSIYITCKTEQTDQWCWRSGLEVTFGDVGASVWTRAQRRFQMWLHGWLTHYICFRSLLKWYFSFLKYFLGLPWRQSG